MQSSMLIVYRSTTDAAVLRPLQSSILIVYRSITVVAVQAWGIANPAKMAVDSV